MNRPGFRPMNRRELQHAVNAPPDGRKAFGRAIDELVTDGRVVALSRGRLAPAARPRTVQGRLVRHPDGFGFVVPDEGGEDLFLPPGSIGDGMSGDRVEARVLRDGRGGRVRGEIVRTLLRRSRRVLGVFMAHGASGEVHPFDPSLGGPVAVPAAFRLGAQDRHVVEALILRGPGRDRQAEGKVLDVLGPLEQAGMGIEVAIRRFGLETAFPREVQAAAERLPARIGTQAKQGRTRFDTPPPVTIDGETAQDFDDAIAVEALSNGGFRLYVHIADVAAFVEPGGPIDDEARRRATSVYFPGRVLPMLPEKLSNDLCSLRPGVDRLVHTVILELDAAGNPGRTRIADGVIRSAARLTYGQVAELIEHDRRPKGIPPRVVPMLQDAERLRQALRAKRRTRGGIDVDLPEPRILLDVEGMVTGIAIEPRNRAHQLIEECMIAANEAVARWLEEKGASCMFRNHDRPDPFKLEQLAEFAATLGYELPGTPEEIDPPALRRLLESADGRPERPLLGMVALRSMQQARYSMKNGGHFGLASTSYCHFTSPIRRYPDLVVHRLLRGARGGDGVGEARDLDGVAADCSERERNAEAAEREVLAWKKVAFIADREGEVFDGVVTGVARFGLFVQITENLVEGLVRVERLGSDRFEFDESRLELLGSATGRRFRLGDAMRVRVERVDRVLRRVDLSPVEGAGPAEGAQPAEGASTGPVPPVGRRRPSGPKAAKGATGKGRRGRRRGR